MEWTYKGKKLKEIPDEYEGFVYLITNKKTGQKYVGKKLAKFKTTKPHSKAEKTNAEDTKSQTGKLTMVVQTDLMQMLQH